MAKDFSPSALKIMRARSGGRCEGCGQVLRNAGEAHHRKFRSRGGLGTAANGLVLCGFGNADGCHGEAHSGAGPILGWAVGSGFEPEQVAVVHARFGAVTFTDSGLVLAAEGTPCWAHSGVSVHGVAGCSFCRPVGRILWDFDSCKEWF